MTGLGPGSDTAASQRLGIAPQLVCFKLSTANFNNFQSFFFVEEVVEILMVRDSIPSGGMETLTSCYFLGFSFWNIQDQKKNFSKSIMKVNM